MWFSVYNLSELKLSHLKRFVKILNGSLIKEAVSTQIVPYRTILWFIEYCADKSNCLILNCPNSWTNYLKVGYFDAT